MSEFVKGQKLTAESLNQAIESARGLNPTNAVQYAKQPDGSALFNNWITYANRPDGGAKPLDIAIGVQALSSGISLSGETEQIWGLHRVFLQVGQPEEYWLPAAYGLPIGKVNQYAFCGILGWQVHWQNAAYGQKDGKAHWSFWTRKNEPAPVDDIDYWVAPQKLFQDDVDRTYSSTHFWYTGITLETQNSDFYRYKWQQSIVGYPMFLRCRPTEDSQYKNIFRIPILVVSTQADYEWLPLLKNKRSELIQKAQEIYGNMFDCTVIQIEMNQDESDIYTIAQYIGSDKSMDTTYRQQTNFISIKKDYSAGHFRAWANYDNEPEIGTIQYIDKYGKHRTLTENDVIFATDSEGEELEDIPWNGDLMLAGFYSSAGNSMTLSCLSCDYSDWVQDNPNGDATQHLLSALTQPGYESRLIWVRQCGARNFIYFDTCPDFRQSGGGKLPTVFDPIFATNISGQLILSSYSHGMYNYGRSFFTTSSIEEDAHISEGRIGLLISHAISSDAPSATVVGLEDGDLVNSDLTKTIVPLYDISAGRIVCDYRPLMTLNGIRE